METLKLFSEAVEEVQYICEEREDGKKNGGVLFNRCI